MKEEEVTGVRAWLRSKAKMITIYAAMFSAVLGAAVAYNQLDLPLPAWQDDIEAVEAELQGDIQQVAGNLKKLEIVTLNQEWFRLNAELNQAREEYDRAPSQALRNSIARLEAALRNVTAAIAELSR